MGKIMRKCLLLGILILFVLSAAAQLAEGPNQFQGKVTINGQAADDGLLVSAKVDGEDAGAASTINGVYGYESNVLIVPNSGNYAGKTISFFVLNFDTGERDTFRYEPSASRTIDLTLDGDLFCGDNLCGASETCSSCAKDCGVCTSSSPGTSSSGGSGGSGGGGSGGFSSTSQTELQGENPCVPEWVCSDWLPCLSAFQQRVCVDSNKCEDNFARPEERRNCEIPQIEQATSSSAQTTQTNSVPENPSALDKIKGLFGITGAVISDEQQGSSPILMSAILAALVAVIFLFIFRRRARRNY